MSDGAVTLRPTVASDLDDLYQHQADPVAAAMAGFPSRDRPTYFAHWTAVLADDSVVKSTVLVGTEIAGSLVCFGPPQAREIGYWIGREHWGRHVATEALRLFVAEVTRASAARVRRAGEHRVAASAGQVRLRRDGEDGDHLVFTLS